MKETWNGLLEQRLVEARATSRQELASLRRLVERNLKDAEMHGVSDDNRFGMAYEAVLHLSRMAIACAGYRVKGMGFHRNTFVALELAMGSEVSAYAIYFDQCRLQRNDLRYNAAGVVTPREVEVLLEQARLFQALVLQWIGEHHAGLM